MMNYKNEVKRFQENCTVITYYQDENTDKPNISWMVCYGDHTYVIDFYDVEYDNDDIEPIWEYLSHRVATEVLYKVLRRRAPFSQYIRAGFVTTRYRVKWISSLETLDRRGLTSIWAEKIGYDFSY